MNSHAEILTTKILETVGTYLGDHSQEPLDFFDVIEALGKVGIHVMYQSAVEHEQPIFTEEQFATVGEMVSKTITEALNAQHYTPAVEIIGLVSNLAYLSHWHNEKIKEYLKTLASSEAEKEGPTS